MEKMSETQETLTATVEEFDPAADAESNEKAKLVGEKLVNKIKYLGYQMNTMDAKERLKYSGQFEKLSKSLGKLRKMIRQNMPEDSWHLTVWICVTILVLIYAFFGYKLYKSLVERDRKREEKLKAKQSKKKK